MVREQNPNLEILMLAVDRLGGLADEMVFVSFPRWSVGTIRARLGCP